MINQLTDVDLRLCTSRIPKDIRALMAKRNVWIGGGFIRSTISGESVSDIDLFGTTKENLSIAAYQLCAERSGARLHETKNAISLFSSPRLPVQFITRWLYEKPDEVLASFDFTIAQAVIWAEADADGKVTGWKSACSEGFYPDLAAKRLIYTFPKRNEDAGGSILRVRKFLKRGYNIQAMALGGAIARLVSGIDFTTIPMAQSGGDKELAIARVVGGLLREVDPLVIVDGFPLDEHEISGLEGNQPVQAAPTTTLGPSPF